jgi:hypothetical protein
MGRRTGEKAKVTLFSFLDILTFCIGSLILILISITLISSENKIKDIIIKVKAEEEEMKKVPIYLEVQRDQVVILPKNLGTSFEKLNEKDSHFMQLMGSLNRHKEYIIFAVRPKGIMTFKKARSITEKMGVDIGFEPIEEEWNIVVK